MTDITLEKSIAYLISKDYLVVLEGKLCITNKLHRDYKELKIEKEQKKKELSGREYYNEFAKKASVPSFIQMSNGQKFTVKYYTPSVLAYLKKAISAIGYDKLVEVTKSYYEQEDMARTTLQKFLSKELWRDWMEMNPIGRGGENRFEE